MTLQITETASSAAETASRGIGAAGIILIVLLFAAAMICSTVLTYRIRTRDPGIGQDKEKEKEQDETVQEE